MGGTVSVKGQITIPKNVRDSLGIESGDSLEFEVRGNECVFRKKPLANSPTRGFHGIGCLGWWTLMAGQQTRSWVNCGQSAHGIPSDCHGC